MEKRAQTNFLAPIFGVVIFALLMILSSPITAQAAPQHGFGTNPGRIDTVNENDFHTSQWDRFSFNYRFTSGTDHRFALGRPTTFNGFVPRDISTVNIRRDANVSLRPPQYGIFSGQFQTAPSSHFFTQPVNPHFHQAVILDDPNVNPQFDTLQQGSNAQPIASQSTGRGGFLPPTSIGTSN